MSFMAIMKLCFCAYFCIQFGICKTDQLTRDNIYTLSNLTDEEREERLLFSSHPSRNEAFGAPNMTHLVGDISSLKNGDKSDEDWGYNDDNGPNYWPQICHFGKRQSPINIDTRQTIRMTVPQLHFENYNWTFENISAENNGHSVMFSGFDQKREEAPYLYGGEFTTRYILHQFHFHWSHKFSNGSEHTINRIHYPVEIHMVHIREDLSFSEAINSTDGVVVLAVFGMIGEDGVAFERIADNFPNFTHRGDKSNVTFNPIVLLPPDTLNFYRYDGSLTTPGCFETVDWLVFHEPIPITEQQLALLRLVEVWGGSDADTRPIQPINDRRIFDCFSMSDE